MNVNRYVVAGHNHFDSFGKFDGTGNVGSSEIELRSVVVEERSMSSAFFFGKDVNLTAEFGVSLNGAGFRDNLTPFDTASVDTTKKGAYVIACLRFVKSLSEHFKTGNNRSGGLFLKTYDFNGIADVSYASFNSSGCNRTTTRDREYVFDGKKERLRIVSFRSGNVVVDSVHKFKDALSFGGRKNFFFACAAGSLFESLKSRTLDDGGIVAGESVLVKKSSDFHFNEFEKFGIVYLVALVKEYDDIGNAYLTSKKDVFSGLRHRTVGSGNYEDRAVHLSSAGDHVLNVVRVSRAVNVSVVTLVGLILNVSRVNRNTSRLFFGRFIDLVISHCFGVAFASHNHRDSRSQSGLTVVNVADSTDVYVRFASVKFCFCHFCFLRFYDFIFYFCITVAFATR
ncbi:uncharacterized protein BN767_00670 [Acidiphilium sp. CAG:727]|nr:uncharacterized protein BN767_00670 [Acidiphilium sp. CAG:727]